MPERFAHDAAALEALAREALLEIAPADAVGGLLDAVREDEGVVTLHFAALQSGYPGWRWTASVSEVEGLEPSVLEVELLPGDGALLAPEWVPWADRLEEYRAAQAAAGEPDETVELAADEADLEELGDSEDADEDSEDDPDIDDPDIDDSDIDDVDEHDLHRDFDHEVDFEPDVEELDDDEETGAP